MIYLVDINYLMFISSIGLNIGKYESFRYFSSHKNYYENLLYEVNNGISNNAQALLFRKDSHVDDDKLKIGAILAVKLDLVPRNNLVDTTIEIEFSDFSTSWYEFINKHYQGWIVIKNINKQIITSYDIIAFSITKRP